MNRIVIPALFFHTGLSVNKHLDSANVRQVIAYPTKFLQLKTSVQGPNHETCLVLEHYACTKLQQTVATSHIWLLTSKLIKKTAIMTTYRAVKYQICRYSIWLCQQQKHGTFQLSKGRCVTCLVLVYLNYRIPLFHGLRVQYFHDLCILMP